MWADKSTESYTAKQLKEWPIKFNNIRCGSTRHSGRKNTI